MDAFTKWSFKTERFVACSTEGTAYTLPIMRKLPFLFNSAEPVEARLGACRDVLSGDDPLPAVVEILPNGRVLTNGTRVTDVRHETTDDN
jgi:hypothetical protein